MQETCKGVQSGWAGGREQGGGGAWTMVALQATGTTLGFYLKASGSPYRPYNIGQPRSDLMCLCFKRLNQLMC